ILASLAFFTGAFGIFKSMAVSVPGWSTDFGKVAVALVESFGGIVTLFFFFGATFTVGAKIMGFNVPKYVQGFIVLFILSVLITILGSNQYMKQYQLETPLLALVFGMVVSNLMPLPGWFKEALRTEYYVKTGIILMGATLPFTIIMSAGPLAILQATIVSVTTFFSIYLAATRLFKLDPRFGATLGAGGSICGVSGSIAVGGACRAEKEHVSIAISMVVIWAVIMIAVLPGFAHKLGMEPGPAGAWIGTSEFADAAGFAAAEQYNAIAGVSGDTAVKTFTLMKVVGRDMFVGLWALMVAILSVTVWEKKSLAESERVDYGEVWRRFPKFVMGFFAASILTTLIIAALDPKTAGTYSKDVLGVVKNLRGWTFTWTFLSIGFTTRFRELTNFGWKPLAAFAIGVLINVPLGYWLSNVVFVDYWMGVK
ncbi:YeiH family protein, partial [Acetonema longum]